MAMDGGSIALHLLDSDGSKHRVLLVQHAFPSHANGMALPGRLYLDDVLISVRSPEEGALLEFLRDPVIAAPSEPTPQRTGGRTVIGEDLQSYFAAVDRSPADALRHLVKQVVEFVGSEAYLRFAERVEQAADPTRYTVWVAWDPGTRNQVVVRLGRVLGIGLQAARESLDRGAPLAKDVTALEVSELAGRYSAEGLALRVEPSFRWRLA
jgi:hypothetical protein